MSEHITITKGTCFALFVYDIGLSVNLTDAEHRLIAGRERGRLRHKTRAPQYFEDRPAPLRLLQEGSAFDGRLWSIMTCEASALLIYSPTTHECEACQ
jgi:hypothetical protein